MSDKIKVAVRIRPTIKREIEKGLPEIWHVDKYDNTIKLIDADDPRSGEQHTFDYVFDKSTSNAEIYEHSVGPMVELYLEGYNCSIFAYGQTSSGKTYTINGCVNDAGIISRVADSLFKRVNTKSDHKFLFRVSYVEIYNEKIYDLLTMSNAEVKTREDCHGNMILNAKETITATTEEIMQVIAIGKRNRKVHSTNMNINSSRSHAIFRITMECAYMYEYDEKVKVCHFDLVDLAGSERLAQAQTSGIHFKEGTFINRSLTALGIVIQQLADNRPHISYRNTKLTFILRNSLGGNAKTLFIVNMTPVPSEDSHITLQFANRAKTIKNRPCINTISSESSLAAKCQRRIDNLEMELLKVLNQNRDLQTDIEKQDEYVEVLENRIKIINQAFTIPEPSHLSSSSARRHTISTYDSHVVIKHVTNDDSLDRSQFPPIDPDASEIFSEVDKLDLPFQTDVDVDLSHIVEEEAQDQPQDIDLQEQEDDIEIDLDVVIEDIGEQGPQGDQPEDAFVQAELENLHIDDVEEEEEDARSEASNEDLVGVYDGVAGDYVLQIQENDQEQDDAGELPNFVIMQRELLEVIERHAILLSARHRFDNETATRQMKDYQDIVQYISWQVGEQASKEFYRVRSCPNLSTFGVEELPKPHRNKSLNDLKDKFVICSALNLSDVIGRLKQLKQILGEENKLKTINEELQPKITFYNEVLGILDPEAECNQTSTLPETLTVENDDLKKQIAMFEAMIYRLEVDNDELNQVLVQEIDHKTELARSLENKHREVLELKEDIRSLKAKSCYECEKLSKLIGKLTVNLKEKDKTIDEWGVKYNHLKTELDTLVTERHALLSIMSEASEESARTAAELTKLNDEYKYTTEKYKNENTILSNQLKEYLEKSYNLKDQLKQTEKDLTKLRGKEVELLKEISDLREQVKDRTVETNQLTKENTKLKSKIYNAVPVTRSNETEIKKLEEQLREKGVESNILIAQNEQLKKDILDARKRYAEKSPESAKNLHDLLALQEQAIEYKKIMKELEIQLSSHSAKNKEQARDIVILKRQIDEKSIKQRDIEYLEDKLKLSNVETNNFKAKADQLRRELDEFQKKCYENGKNEQQYMREINKLTETDAENKKRISKLEHRVNNEVKSSNTMKEENKQLKGELTRLKENLNSNQMSEFVSSQGEIITTLHKKLEKIREQFKLKEIEKHKVSEEFEKLKQKFRTVKMEQRDKDERLENSEAELEEYKKELKITKEALDRLQKDYIRLKARCERGPSSFSTERRTKKSVMQDSSRNIQESREENPCDEEPVDYKKLAEESGAELIVVKKKYNKLVDEFNTLQLHHGNLRTKYDQLKVISRSRRERITYLEEQSKERTGARSPSP